MQGEEVCGGEPGSAGGHDTGEGGEVTHLPGGRGEESMAGQGNGFMNEEGVDKYS